MDYKKELTLWYDHPAKKWTQSLPLGNGRIGAMIYGGIETEKICLNEDTLWSGYPIDPVDKNAYEYVEKARTLTCEGRADKAQKLIEDKVLGTWGQSYMPLGDLLVTFNHDNTMRKMIRFYGIVKIVHNSGTLTVEDGCLKVPLYSYAC
ncbi:MAG: Alpha-L-fucosidase [Anaerocolumna sp.]|jgi:alpha-L-fucosidase 2|nr:Alpha-L-fucosidase [Anaerocolumna sp.]